MLGVIDIDWQVKLIDWDQMWDVAGPFFIVIITLLITFGIVYFILQSLPERYAVLFKWPAVIICLAAGVISFLISMNVWASR